MSDGAIQLLLMIGSWEWWGVVALRDITEQEPLAQGPASGSQNDDTRVGTKTFSSDLLAPSSSERNGKTLFFCRLLYGVIQAELGLDVNASRIIAWWGFDRALAARPLYTFDIIKSRQKQTIPGEGVLMCTGAISLAAAHSYTPQSFLFLFLRR